MFDTLNISFDLVICYNYFIIVLIDLTKNYISLNSPITIIIISKPITKHILNMVDRVSCVSGLGLLILLMSLLVLLVGERKEKERTKEREKREGL